MQARLYLHCHELLEEQLACVGYLDLADVLTGVTPLAFVAELLKIRHTEKTALLANVHAIAVAYIKEAFLKEASSTMRDHAVTLHLAESKTSVSGTTFSGLPGEDLSRTTSARMDLVTDHMLQALIVSRVEEDHDFEALTGESVVHHLVTISLVAQIM